MCVFVCELELYCYIRCTLKTKVKTNRLRNKMCKKTQAVQGRAVLNIAKRISGVVATDCKHCCARSETQTGHKKTRKFILVSNGRDYFARYEGNHQRLGMIGCLRLTKPLEALTRMNFLSQERSINTRYSKDTLVPDGASKG